MAAPNKPAARQWTPPKTDPYTVKRIDGGPLGPSFTIKGPGVDTMRGGGDPKQTERLTYAQAAEYAKIYAAGYAAGHKDGKQDGYELYGLNPR